MSKGSNPRPARRLNATPVNGLQLLTATSSNPRPARRLNATSSASNCATRIAKFQSSSSPKAERYIESLGVPDVPLKFQSSSSPKAERYLPFHVRAYLVQWLCSNPRPARRLNATECFLPVPTGLTSSNPRPARRLNATLCPIDC